jgi:hypothetical protein
MLGAQGLLAGRDLYRATPAVSRDLGFIGLIQRTAPFNRFLQLSSGCGGPILTRLALDISFNMNDSLNTIMPPVTKGRRYQEQMVLYRHDIDFTTLNLNNVSEHVNFLELYIF